MTTAFSPKQPSEVIPGCYVDFKKRLLSGETLVSATVTCTVATMVKVGSVVAAGTRVTWTIEKGTDGQTGIFTITATGDQGSVRETEVSMLVDETP